MARAIVALALMGLPHPGLAQARVVTAEEALANGRAMIADAVAPRCREQDENPEEIIVCGRTGRDYRLPLPNERGSPEGPRRTTGDMPRASAAPIRVGGCSTKAGAMCTQGLNATAVLGFFAKLGKKIIQ